jgi:hypothetical protein
MTHLVKRAPPLNKKNHNKYVVSSTPGDLTMNLVVMPRACFVIFLIEGWRRFFQLCYRFEWFIYVAPRRAQSASVAKLYRNMEGIMDQLSLATWKLVTRVQIR